ncbi:Uncharacterized membrane protein YfcA [Roseovarius azorensis]|uniref:Probable membrane transporter protein n=1 Tax=Roseovarius azorensis TaxID=1287727 RepID=A0A1H7NAA8_9RHOB|nr:sulfite exporter TauE/SafE family protein [Roseovarius azorensis]SEL20522.1 Uncharacterized membrane protein YfcA [Roseovarius azorensis]
MTPLRHRLYSFSIGAVVGVLGGLIGLGGAEFRLPALVGILRFTAREAVAINLMSSFVVLAAALPFRAGTVPLGEVAAHWPVVLGMLAGSLTAAWIGAGVLSRLGDRMLGLAILVLLVALGVVLIAESLLVVAPLTLLPESVPIAVAAAVVAGIVIGAVSSLLGVAGGELIIPVLVLVFGVEVKLAGSIAMLVGLPTIAIGLMRHFGPGMVLRRRAVWRGTLLPLVAGSVPGAILGALALGLVSGTVLKLGLGLLLIWSAWAVFRHLPGERAEAAQKPAPRRDPGQGV